MDLAKFKNSDIDKLLFKKITNKQFIVFRSTAITPKAKIVTFGNWSFRQLGGSIRDIRWGNLEIIREINCSIRDKSWATYKEEGIKERYTKTNDIVVFEHSFYIDTRLKGSISYTFDIKGEMNITLVLKANKNFYTNRAGLTILHPLRGVVGESIIVKHGNNKQEKLVMPQFVSPWQLAFDIKQLTHFFPNLQVSIDFLGEIFEMEDQRNWTDASFKTYCRPLALPFPYKIAVGEEVCQQIKVKLIEKIPTLNHLTTPRSKPYLVERCNLIQSKVKFPKMFLAMEQGWQPPDSLKSKIEHILSQTAVGYCWRINENQVKRFSDKTIAIINKWTIKKIVDIEIVLPKINKKPIKFTVENYFKKIASCFNKSGILAKNIIITYQPYLKTLNPTKAGFPSPDPSQCVGWAKKYFPKSRIGCGVLTNFTEFNRLQEKLDCGNFGTFSTTALVHAADDGSVIQTLETLPYIFKTFNKIRTKAKNFRSGLMSIGMRGNPYTSNDKLVFNEQLIQQTMVANDPRQLGLFAGAFAIGLLSQSVKSAHRTEAITLAALAGPFAWWGWHSQKNNQLLFFPLYHVVNFFTTLTDKKVVGFEICEGVYGIGVQEQKKGNIKQIKGVIANCSFIIRKVILPFRCKIKYLNQRNYNKVVHQSNWFSNSRGFFSNTINLPPCSIAFISK